MKAKILTLILIAFAMAANVDAQTRRTTAKKATRTTATTKKAAAAQTPVKEVVPTPVDRLVKTFEIINQEITGVRSQQRMAQIIESTVQNTADITEEEAAATTLTSTDKERLSQSIGNVFRTMVTNLGAGQSQAQQLIDMTESQIKSSTTLKDMMIKLNMGLFSKSNGRTSF